MAAGCLTVVIEPEEEGGYHVFCPELKGCHTQGDTLKEALGNAAEAIEVYLESLLEDGEPIPLAGWEPAPPHSGTGSKPVDGIGEEPDHATQAAFLRPMD